MLQNATSRQSTLFAKTISIFRDTSNTYFLEIMLYDNSIYKQNQNKWTLSIWFFFVFYNEIWAATWDFQQCGMCDHQSLRSACAYAQSDQSLCLSLEYSWRVKLLTEYHLKLLSIKGGCTGSSESTLVKMPHCLKSHVTAHIWNPSQYQV